MKILLDANLPDRLRGELAEKFRIEADRAEDATPDEVLFERSRRNGQIFLTLDADFQNILRYPPGTHPGLVVFRLHHQGYEHVRKAVVGFFETLGGHYDQIRNAMTVVKETSFKVYRPK